MTESIVAAFFIICGILLLLPLAGILLAYAVTLACTPFILAMYLVKITCERAQAIYRRAQQ